MSIPRSMTCPRCGDDLDYTVERDGTAWVLFTPLIEHHDATRVYTGYYRSPLPGEMAPFTHGRTTCGCVWPAEQLERLHDEATERAAQAERDDTP